MLSLSQNNIVVRTSLFFRLRSGRFISSWEFFADTTSDAERNEIIEQLTEWRCNSLVFLMHNSDPRCPTNFYKDGVYGSKGDLQKLEWAVRGWMQPLQEKGALLWPVYWCDGDWCDQEINGQTIPAIARPYNKPANMRHIQGVTQVLSPYVRGFIVGIESNEYLAVHELNEVLTFARQFTMCIGIHEQLNPEKRSMSPLASFLAYEDSRNPDQWKEVSAEEAASEATKVANSVQRPMWWLEYELDVATESARAKTRLLETVPYTVGVGGPT